MSKGGGKTQTVVQQNTVEPWAREMAQHTFGVAKGIANQPFVPYAGQRVAGLSGDEAAARQMVLDAGGGAAVGQGANLLTAAGHYAPQMITGGQQAVTRFGAVPQAQGTSYQAAGQAPVQQVAAAGAQASGMEAGQLAGTDLAPYMNPFTSEVTGRALGDLNRQLGQMQTQARSGASAAGAYGGSRAALLESENNRNYMDRAGSLAANLYSQNFLNAQQQAGADIGRRMEAGAFNAQAANDMSRFNAGQDLAAQQMNQAANLNSALNFAGRRDEASRFGAQAGLQANLANQQAGMTAGLANQAAANDANRWAAQSWFQAQQANQQAGLENARRQMQAGSLLGNLGAQQRGMDLQRAGALAGFGEVQRGIEQQNLDALYNQHQQWQDWPMRGLGALTQAMGTGQGYAGSSSTQSTPIHRNRIGGALQGGMGGLMTGAALGSLMAPAGATGIAALGGPWALAGGAALGALGGLFG